MVNRYEVEGRLEGNRVIRLSEPLPCKEGPVRVIVTPHAEETEPREGNRAALEALDSLLAEPDELSSRKWMELEHMIEQHPFRIRKGSSA